MNADSEIYLWKLSFSELTLEISCSFSSFDDEAESEDVENVSNDDTDANTEPYSSEPCSWH